jgi:hypothetical protein
MKTCPRIVRGQPQKDGHSRTPPDSRTAGAEVFTGILSAPGRPLAATSGSSPALPHHDQAHASTGFTMAISSGTAARHPILNSPRQHTASYVCPGQVAGEPACRPGSVHPLARAGGHPSGTAVAGSLVRSTREHRAGRPQTLAEEAGPAARSPLDLAPGGVYRAAAVTCGAGGLLHHQRSHPDLRGHSLTGKLLRILSRPPASWL